MIWTVGDGGSDREVGDGVSDEELGGKTSGACSKKGFRLHPFTLFLRGIFVDTLMRLYSPFSQT